MYVVNSESGKRSIKSKGNNLWNKLPTDIKKSSHAHLLNLYLNIIYYSRYTMCRRASNKSFM